MHLTLQLFQRGKTYQEEAVFVWGGGWIRVALVGTRVDDVDGDYIAVQSLYYKVQLNRPK